MKIRNKKILNILLLTIIPLIVALLVMTAVISGRNEKERHASAATDVSWDMNSSIVYRTDYTPNGYLKINFVNLPYTQTFTCYLVVLPEGDGGTTFNFSWNERYGFQQVNGNSYYCLITTEYISSSSGFIISLDGVQGDTQFVIYAYVRLGEYEQTAFDFMIGYDFAYNQGYSDGYNDKFGGTALTPQTLFLEPVHQWLNMELFPGFTLAGAFEVVLFVALALIFIKMFSK